MLVADARLLADERIFRAVGLHERALTGDAALQLFRAGIVGSARWDITLAAGEKGARRGEKQSGNNGFHAWW